MEGPPVGGGEDLPGGKLHTWPHLLRVELLAAMAVVALLGVLAIVLHAVNGWRLAARSLRVRLGETVLALAALYLGWFILAFGLVSFNTQF